MACATHALGKMPLEVSAYTVEGGLLSRLVKDGKGQLNASLIE